MARTPTLASGPRGPSCRPACQLGVEATSAAAPSLSGLFRALPLRLAADYRSGCAARGGRGEAGGRAGGAASRRGEARERAVSAEPRRRRARWGRSGPGRRRRPAESEWGREGDEIPNVFFLKKKNFFLPKAEKKKKNVPPVQL